MKGGVSMRYLNQDAIMASISYNDIIEAVENALYNYKNGFFNMPERFHYTYENKTLLYMPCFSQGTLGTKILTVFPENTHKNHPAIDGLMLLNNYETGEPKALIDGKLLTALRTGAVGAMGTKHLSPSSVTRLGLIGAGAQGIYQILFACHCRPIKDVYITTRSLDKLDKYIDILRNERPDINFHKVDSSKKVVEQAEIIITATSSMTPILPEDEALYKGKTFIAIGSYQPMMRELPNALMTVADEIYVDIDYAMEESGDLHLPLAEGIISQEKIFTIAELIHGDKKSPTEHQTIVYKSVGMALFDVIVGEKILSCAIKKNIGQLLK
jgi:ornithine cyclodeaminase